MTDTTPRTGAPLLAAAQAQKHVTHNEALYQFDAFLCARFIDRTLAMPPSSPADGDTYLVATGGTGAWTGQDGNVAYCADGDWRFYPPFGGLVAYVFDESVLIVYTGSAWVDYSSLIALEDVPMLGVNTTASSTNKLAVQSNAILFTDQPTGSGGTGDVRATLSKQALANTASFLFQDDYSGRAYMGLTGYHNFHFKVSPDGSTWTDAMDIDASTGSVSIASADINGGTIDGAAIGGATPASGAFTTLTASGAVTLSPASAAVAISPAGALTVNPAAASTINNCSVGATTPGTGKFTTLQATAAVTLSPASANVSLAPTGTGVVTIDPATAGTMDNVAVGQTTAAAGKFTSLSAASGINGTNIGAVTAGTGAFTTLGASGAVTLSPASAAVAISPSGTGTVAISPAGALTVNPAAASTINNCSVGATTAGTGRFSTLQATGAVTLSPASANVVLSPTGTGVVTIGPATAGTLDNVAVGQTTAAAGKFTTLQASGGINGTNLGATTAGTGAFTTLAASAAVTLSPASANVVLSPTGSGTVTVNPATAGTIDNVAIGSTTPTTGKFTTLSASTQLDTAKVSSNAASALDLQTSGGTQFEIAHTASSVNYLQATGAATGAGIATLAAAGTDSNIDIVLTPKGTGNVRIPTVANGSVATALSSLGPTGSHATVQEWFAVKNASGTIRYIPAF